MYVTGNANMRMELSTDANNVFIEGEEQTVSNTMRTHHFFLDAGFGSAISRINFNRVCGATARTLTIREVRITGFVAI